MVGHVIGGKISRNQSGLEGGEVMKQLFHVYECQDCVLTFAVEQDLDDQSDICCPLCKDDNLRDVASGEMEVK